MASSSFIQTSPTLSNSSYGAGSQMSKSLSSRSSSLMLPIVDSTLAEKEAAKLFHSMSVEEIRVKSFQTRKDIDEKKQELRKLVGTRYRDLIDSADSIIQMKNLSGQLFDRMSKTEQYCNLLMKKRRDQMMKNPKEKKHQQETETEARRRKYTLGKQIKFLVDTPEQIWSALEGNNYLRAATLYLSAENVYSKLRESKDEYSTKILASIPLLSRQWAIIMQFPPKILQLSKKYLLLSDKDYAGALCAIVLLEKATPKAVFSEFLRSQSKAIHKCLTSVSPKSEDAASNEQDVTDRLSAVVEIVHTTVHHVKLLFYPQNADQKTGLLYKLLANIQEDANNGITLPNLPVINAEEIKKEALEWLGRCSQDIKNYGKQLLDKITRAKELKSVEAKVLEVIGSASKSGEPGLRESQDQELPLSWKELSMFVLNEHFQLWKSLFQDIFQTRARDVITLSFQKLSISQQLDQCLAQIKGTSDSAHQDRNVGNFIWMNYEEDRIDVTKKKAGGVTGKLDSIVQYIDAQLSSFMEDLNHLFEKQILEKGDPNSDAAKLRSFLQTTCFESVSSISKDLEKKLLAFQADLSSMQNTSEKKLVTFNGEENNIHYAQLNPNVMLLLDQVMFIGRVGKSIYTQSSQFKKILNTTQNNGLGNSTGNLLASLTSTRDITFSSPRRRAFKSDKKEDSELYLQAKHLLRKQYLFAHVMWINCVVQVFGGVFGKCVANDVWNSSNPRRKTWEELALTVESEDNKSVEEKIYLPFQPSAYLLSFLFAVCKETHRVGSHTLDKVLLQYLVYELSEKVMSIYADFMDKHLQKDKEGIIQLLFDIRFVFDVLSGRKDVEAVRKEKDLMEVLLNAGKTTPRILSASGDEKEDKSSWNQRVSDILERVENELDPIDMAFYRPHLKNATMKCYKRSTLLWGFLVQLNRMHADYKMKATLQEQHNVLALAPMPSRFTLLPVSTPTSNRPSAPATPNEFDQASIASSNYMNQQISYAAPVPDEKTLSHNRQSSQSLVDKFSSMFGTTSAASHPVASHQAAPEKKETKSSWW
eukprot:TRINITY_DN5329_c0_g1_i1.p1 TRINITY_DN5329_c0_g1~~TRINITY_DN5329_c0_g1_i1.p1  ORF type:complete len:1044 (+),score=290.63 TRINITY_DN5329_c0_g1_i1:112-3243(+)